MEAVNKSLEYFGIAISLLILICCVIEAKKSNKQTKYIIAMLVVNIFVLLCDALTWELSNIASLEVLLSILNFFVYSLGYVMTALFTGYLVSYISAKVKLPKYFLSIIAGLCMIAVILVVISMFNGMYFSYKGGIYQRGKLYWISQVYPILIMVTDMLVVVLHRKQIGWHDTLSFLSYGIMPVIAMIIQIVVFGITLLYISTTLSLLVIYLMVHIEQNRRIAEQEVELGQARVSIMLSQIQPHFLYNSLSVIRELCNSDPKLAEKVILDFSNYLRSNLDSLKATKPVPFARELEHTRIFLDLEQMQYGERLTVDYEIKCTDFLLPTLTLQPIVENSVKYGMKSKEEVNVIITTYEDEKNYFIIVEDNGGGFCIEAKTDDKKSHVGLENVRERLKAQSNSSLSIRSEQGKGTIVTISIPKARIKQ